MKTYTSFSTVRTHQNQPLPHQVPNSAGGYSWAVDHWAQLERFLILGTEGGTYYIKQQDLTIDNARSCLKCIDENGLRVIDTVVDISTSGRAAKNDPALFVLAMCAGEGKWGIRMHALKALPKVARIGTHLFTFLTYAQQFRGWGRNLREGVAKWYTDKDINRLAYQMIKYRQRNGWSHRDVLRKSHPIPKNKEWNHLFHWATQGKVKKRAPELVKQFEAIQKIKDASQAAYLITEHNLPRECVPPDLLNNVAIWDALLVNMPMTALIRNLGKMTSIGLLKPMSDATNLAVRAITAKELIKRARVHPLSILVALKTYEQGHGFRGKLKWDPVASIIDALDEAFYTSFDTVVPTGKRTMLALDVSGSMTWNDIMGMPGITPRVGAAAMSLVTANVEDDYAIMAFSDDFVNLPISPKQRLDDVVRMTDNIDFGGTDCALPMVYALENSLKVDTFVVYTDSETWSGQIHPAQALKEYRNKTGIPAKLVVVGMEANPFTIADPNDLGMMDVVGFDTATPNIISDFARG